MLGGRTFSGIRFFLFGFNSPQLEQAKSKLVSVGAVDVGKYGPDCTHVIVYNTVYDDPICVTARKDGKKVVTSLWLDHSLEFGEPGDVANVMYRPPKDLNGIPGAKDLVMCLTGYQRQDREDIMTMVGLMGAQFSKPLVATKVTHLICYKFEGEKYELAKKVKKIKLVNNTWLEDCLKAWELLPEEHYSKSTYELEMMRAEVNDSDEETGGLAGNLRVNVDTIPTLQNEKAGAQETTGPANVIRKIKEEKNSDQKSMPGGFNHMGQQSPMCHRENGMISNLDVQCQDNNLGNDLQFIPGEVSLGNGKEDKISGSGSSRKTPTKKSSLPLHVGYDMGTSSELSSKRVAGGSDVGKCSPSVRKQTAGKLGGSDGGVEDNLAMNVTDGICPTNLEPDKENGASTSIGVRSPEQSFDSDSGKGGFLSSSKTPRRSSLSFQSVEKLQDTNRKVGEASAEKSVDACTFNVEQDKGLNVSAYVSASNVGDGLFNEEGVEGSGGLSPQKRKVDDHSNVSPTTLKSRKLASSASKRIDATDPKTSVTSTLGKSKDVSLNPSSYIEDNTAMSPSCHKLSPNASSVKSKTKIASASRNLASEMLQSRKCTKKAAATSSNTDSVSTSTALPVDSKRPEAHNQQQNASSTSCTKDLEAAKSDSLKLNSDGQMGNSVSKPVRKKTVARRTLGARPKLSKKSAAAHENSPVENSIQEDAAIHLTTDQEGRAKSPSSDKPVISPPAMGAVDAGSKSLQTSFSVFDAGLLDDETEPPAEVEPQNENSVAVELQSAETRNRGRSRVVLSESDEEDVATSPSNKKHVEGVTEAEAGDNKKKMVRQKKGLPGKSKKSSVLSSKEISNSTINAEHGVEREQVDCTEADKNCDDLLMSKSKRPEEVAEETVTAVPNVKGTTKGDKQPRKLAGKKRRGTLILNKPEGSGEVGRENEPDPASAKDQNEEETIPRKPSAKSKLTKAPVEANKENDPVGKNAGTSKSRKLAGKSAGNKKRGTLVLDKPEGSPDDDKENDVVVGDFEGRNNSDNCNEKLSGKPSKKMRKSDEMSVPTKPSGSRAFLCSVKDEPARFLLSGHRLQRKEFQQIIKRLNGKLCRDSHQWSYQATHLVVPEPLRRTEKFFAAAASGRWILKSDYLTECSQAGKFLPEEPYEWHQNGLSEDGAINLEAPRKWRLVREKTGHGAFYGMRIVIYGECIAPPLETLKRVVKAGDGTILATSPPYSRFIKAGVDFAIVSPGMPRADIWVQEFLRNEIPCVSADYLVEYVCKPGYPLDKHIQYNTHEWAAKSHSKLLSMSEEIITEAETLDDDDDEEGVDDIACQVCGSTERGEVMLICGDESGSTGCGLGTHIDCLDPPLESVPEEDWFCTKCSDSSNKPPVSISQEAEGIVQEEQKMNCPL